MDVKKATFEKVMI